MSDIKKIKHYSMENPATVYDEESLTALQLVGRLGAKVNETVDTVNTFTEEMTNDFKKFTDSVPGIVSDKVQEHIENGTFDTVIEEHLGDLNTRVDNIVASSGNDNTEVVDGRVTAYSETHKTLGEAVRTQFAVLGVPVSKVVDHASVPAKDFVNGEYYSTGNGGRGKGAEYQRSKYLVPFPEHKLLTSNVKTGDAKILVTCYDRDFNYLGYVACIDPYNGENTAPNTPKCTFTGTAYIGFTVPVDVFDSYDEVTVTALDSAMIETVHVDDPSQFYNPVKNGYVIYDDCYINSQGYPVQSPAWRCAIIPVGKEYGIKSVFTSAQVQTDGIFINGNNAVVSATIQSLPTGRIYTPNADAVFCCLNFPVLDEELYDENGDPTGIYQDRVNRQYATFIFDGVRALDKPLNGKNVVVIGDSLVWLDGQYGYDNQYPLAGWQKCLRKAGAVVRNFGFNGKALCDTTAEGDGIATLFINELDNATPNADAIIFMCGTNDIRLGVSYDDFESTLYDLISQLQNYYSEGKIPQVYVCSVLAGSDSSRPYTDIYNYRWETKTFCEENGVHFLDLHSVCSFGNVNKAMTTRHQFTYDGTHPNVKGMSIIGKYITRYLEDTLYDNDINHI